MGVKTYTTFQISKFCDVYPTTVINWIEDGKLNAFKTPGGHRRVRRDDLLDFLKEYNLPVNHTFKMDENIKILIIGHTNKSDKIENYLKQNKFQYITTSSEFEAGYLTGKWNPNLIMINLHSMNSSWRSICQSLKTEPETKNIPLIAIIPSEKNLVEPKQITADDYVIENESIEQVINKFRHYLSI